MNKIKTQNKFLSNAINYKEKFGLDFIPLRIVKAGKKPMVSSWEELQDNEQSIDELNLLNWDRANGMGMINKTITTLDFDDCSDLEFIINLVTDLGGKYWLVKTGRGFHLHIILEGVKYLETIFGKKGVYKFYPKTDGILKHIEVRISSCYTAFPPSKHSNGNNYKFIDGEPDCLPDKIDAKKLIEVLNKYFILSIKDKEPENRTGLNDDLSEIFANGTTEGNRHNSLIRLFGVFHSRYVKRQMLKTTLIEWNKKNKPPINDKEINKTITDLFRRYDKGLDGIFIQFNNCLLQLEDENKLKLEKIICYGVIEYDGDRKIIEELGLTDKLNVYHQECKKLVEHYENWTGRKDQIVRVGQTLILDAYYKRFRFEYFCIYVGMISYLGRNSKKPAKQISQDNIRYRAMGYKNEDEYLCSNSKAPPIKKSTIKSGIKKIEKCNLIRSFSLVKGRMKWFSTFFATNEKLAEFVKICEIKKLHKRKSKDLLRLKMQEEIRGEQEKLDAIINNKQINAISSYSSIHLLSNEK